MQPLSNVYLQMQTEVGGGYLDGVSKKKATGTLSIPLCTFSPHLNIPFVNLARKGKRNQSLFGRFHAFPCILLLEVNPKRVSRALLSAAPTNPRKPAPPARF